MEHVDALAGRYAAYAATTRDAVRLCEELRDAETVDTFTELSRLADKQSWFLEAHLEAQAAASNVG
jgi:starvation-inducible DNA-binding protein